MNIRIEPCKYFDMDVVMNYLTNGPGYDMPNSVVIIILVSYDFVLVNADAGKHVYIHYYWMFKYISSTGRYE